MNTGYFFKLLDLLHQLGNFKKNKVVLKLSEFVTRVTLTRLYG